MDLNSIIKRIRAASTAHSYRKVGEMCDVSHESIRRLALSKKPNISLDTYNKIEKGLTRNGF